MKNEIISELTKVASQTKFIDSTMSSDLQNIAKELASSMSDDELDTIINQVEKKAAQEKEAKLINEGDTVVCVDNFLPLFKGRRYLVSDASIPGFLVIKELTQEDVGIFAINRFVLDNNEQ
jgi:hypothetical protein